MSTISSTTGASGAWPDMNAQRTKMREKLFSKADADGNGSVDASELQSMLARLSGNSGAGDSSSSDATALLKKMDSDGDGSLSSTELDAGMRALIGPPPSTMQFAQSRSGASGDSGDASAIGPTARSGDDLFSKIDSNADGSVDAGELAAFKEKMTQAMDGGDSSASSSTSGDDSVGASAMLEKLDTDGDGKLGESEFDAGRPHAAHAGEGPPPPEAGAGSAASGDSSSSADDPLDTNHDGVVSPEERLAGSIGGLLDQLAQASDANGDGTLDKSELGALKDDLKSAFDGALQALQSGGSTLAFASSSATTSSADDGRDAAARLAQGFAKLMQGQYAQFANAASQPSGSAGVSLAA